MTSYLIELIFHSLSWLKAPRVLGTIAVIGVLCHRLYFIRGEHHLKTPLYLKLWCFTSFLLFLAAFTVNSALECGRDEDCLNPSLIVVLLNIFFFTPLFTSILVYRAFEHPLCEFHGPLLASLTKLWHFKQMFNTSNHLFLNNLHRQYGDIIRTGPQELTVVHPDIWQAIGSSDSACIKSAWSDMMAPYVALSSIRTKKGYSSRRKRWDQAFGNSTTSLIGKQKRIRYFANVLLRQIYSAGTRPINVTLWFHNFFFGVMGDFAFGDDFSLPQDLDAASQQYNASDLISEGMSMLRFFTPAPWMGHLCVSIAPYIPLVSDKWNRTLAWAAEICSDKLRNASGGENDRTKNRDAFARFVLSAQSDDDQDSLDRLALYGDAFLMMVAGSHTTAATLTMLFYELACHRDIQEKLRREIFCSRAFKKNPDDDGSREDLDATSLEGLPFLNACISESLRLYPPIPTGSIRQTVEKAILVNGKCIPPQTVIVTPRWSIGRLESAFERPEEFIPERWTTKINMVKDARAFNAFGYGRHICPGKKLGLMELRIVALIVLSDFEFVISPGEKNKTRVVDNIQDGFTASLGSLELVFTPSPQ